MHYYDALFFFLKKNKTKYIGWQYGSLPRSCFSVGELVFRPAPRRNTSSSKHARACVGGYLASNKAKDWFKGQYIWANKISRRARKKGKQKKEILEITFMNGS